MIQQLEKFGATPDVIETTRAQMIAASSRDFELFPDNAKALEVFDKLATQWRRDGGIRTGIDYAALPVVASALGVRQRDRRQLFNDIQVMERETLMVDAERNPS